MKLKTLSSQKSRYILLLHTAVLGAKKVAPSTSTKKKFGATMLCSIVKTSPSANVPPHSTGSPFFKKDALTDSDSNGGTPLNYKPEL